MTTRTYPAPIRKRSDSHGYGGSVTPADTEAKKWHDQVVKRYNDSHSNEGDSVDLAIVADEETSYVHKVVICSQSKKFYDLYNSTPAPVNDPEGMRYIQVQIKPDLRQAMFEFFYTCDYGIGDIPPSPLYPNPLEAQFHVRLYAVSKEYEVVCLQELAKDRFKCVLDELCYRYTLKTFDFKSLVEVAYGVSFGEDFTIRRILLSKARSIIKGSPEVPNGLVAAMKHVPDFAVDVATTLAKDMQDRMRIEKSVRRPKPDAFAGASRQVNLEPCEQILRRSGHETSSSIARPKSRQAPQFMGEEKYTTSAKQWCLNLLRHKPSRISGPKRQRSRSLMESGLNQSPIIDDCAREPRAQQRPESRAQPQESMRAQQIPPCTSACGKTPPESGFSVTSRSQIQDSNTTLTSSPPQHTLSVATTGNGIARGKMIDSRSPTSHARSIKQVKSHPGGFSDQALQHEVNSRSLEQMQVWPIERPMASLSRKPVKKAISAMSSPPVVLSQSSRQDDVPTLGYHTPTRSDGGQQRVISPVCPPSPPPSKSKVHHAPLVQSDIPSPPKQASAASAPQKIKPSPWTELMPLFPRTLRFRCTRCAIGSGRERHLQPEEVERSGVPVCMRCGLQMSRLA